MILHHGSIFQLLHCGHLLKIFRYQYGSETTRKKICQSLFRIFVLKNYFLIIEISQKRSTLIFPAKVSQTLIRIFVDVIKFLSGRSKFVNVTLLYEILSQQLKLVTDYEKGHKFFSIFSEKVVKILLQ